MSSTLPISGALAEATPDSITDLFSRSPETFHERPQDLSRVIDELRANRERQQKAEATGTKAPKPLKFPTTSPTTSSNPDIEI